MFKNYLKIALRNAKKYPAFTLINVTGLSIGLACAILVYLFIKHEFSFDAFHANRARIYRVVTIEQDRGNRTGDYTITQPYPLGPAMQDDLPERLPPA